jgi:inulin fructotransferase (DFA-I-forming)
LLHVDGSNNSIIANHISESMDTRFIKPANAKPVIIRLVAGSGNYIANNHIVATTETSELGDAPNSECFSTQVAAMIATAGLTSLDVTAVRIEPESANNTVLDSGSDAQVVIDRAVNAFRGTPVPGARPASAVA